MFGSFLPGLGWLAPPKSIRAWEPTLLWNQLRSLTWLVLAQRSGQSLDRQSQDPIPESTQKIQRPAKSSAPNNERLDLCRDRGARAALPQNCSPAKLNAGSSLAYGTTVLLPYPESAIPPNLLQNRLLKRLRQRIPDSDTVLVPLECAGFLPM